MGLNFLYLDLVPAAADSNFVRYNPQQLKRYEPAMWNRGYLVNAFVFDNPLDVIICPLLRWGCRYLQVDGHNLVEHVWDDKAIVDLWKGGRDNANALVAIEGLELRDRLLRFAVLDRTSLFNADLSGADLRRASLQLANLLGARMLGTLLEDGELNRAQLQGAWLSGAHLQGAQLEFAQLQGADLSQTALQGASLKGAELQGSNLRAAQLQLADLSSAQLQGAVLAGAYLQGADLGSARLQGADLSGAQLWGAIFGQAVQQSVSISAPKTDLGLADLRNTDFTTDKIEGFRAIFDDAPEGNSRRAAAERLDQLLCRVAALHFTASPDRPVVVSNKKDKEFKNLPSNWLVSSPSAAPLANLLVTKLARDNSDIAGGLAARIYGGMLDGIPKDQVLYTNMACQLLKEVHEGEVKLYPGWTSLLSKQSQSVTECP
jgi:uncharacterized protein YjbI with pentapeptide repeats